MVLPTFQTIYTGLALIQQGTVLMSEYVPSLGRYLACCSSRMWFVIMRHVQDVKPVIGFLWHGRLRMRIPDNYHAVSAVFGGRGVGGVIVRLVKFGSEILIFEVPDIGM